MAGEVIQYQTEDGVTLIRLQARGEKPKVTRKGKGDQA